MPGLEKTVIQPGNIYKPAPYPFPRQSGSEQVKCSLSRDKPQRMREGDCHNFSMSGVSIIESRF